MTRTLLATALASALATNVAPARADGNLTIYSGDFDAVSQSEGQPGGPGFALVDRQLAVDATTRPSATGPTSGPSGCRCTGSGSFASYATLLLQRQLAVCCIDRMKPPS